MGKKVENMVVNKFDADLKLIEEWIQKPIKQIDASLKTTTRIKELNEIVNIDLEYADYRKKTTVPDDENEKNDMKDKDECIETIFQ